MNPPSLFNDAFLQFEKKHHNSTGSEQEIDHFALGTNSRLVQIVEDKKRTENETTCLEIVFWRTSNSGSSPQSPDERVVLRNDDIYYIGSKKAKAASFFKAPPNEWYIPTIKSLSEYRHYVEKHLDVSELQGKTLACLCDLRKRCHGNILLYLIESKVFSRLPPAVLKYQSDASVFSNSFKFDFKISSFSFHSLAHAYYYFLAVNKNVPQEYLQKILSAKNLTNVVSLCKKDFFQKRLFSNPVNKICLMFFLLKKKWESCAEFKAACKANKDVLFVQMSFDKFWGCGGAQQQLKNFEGKNIAGILIMLLIQMNVFNQTDPCQLFHILKQKIIMCTEGMLNVNFVEGLFVAISAVVS